MEEFKIEPYKVYIKINEYGVITAINSSAFLSDTTDWIEVDEGYGDRFHHAQGNYLLTSLIDENGFYQYEYEDGVIKARSDSDIQKDWEEMMLPNLINQKIAESKIKLAEWLASNPILFTDGKYYSVTEEKQSLLNNNLASYERAKSAGVEYPLKWNSTGEECVDWEYSNLLILSLNIAEYVAPKVAIQQTIELNIKACKSIKDLEAIVINYD